MVVSIGGSGLAQSLLARVESRKAQQMQETQGTDAAARARAATNTAATAASAEDDASATVTRSALSNATDRLGGQLAAQVDASRVTLAAGADETSPMAQDEDAAEALDAAGAEEASAGASTADGGETGAATAQAGVEAGGAGGAGGTSSSSSESSDYIAEADTNSDRTVSDEERAAYEKKLAAQAEKSSQESSATDALGRSRAQEVQQAYQPQDREGSVSVSA